MSKLQDMTTFSITVHIWITVLWFATHKSVLTLVVKLTGASEEILVGTTDTSARFMLLAAAVTGTQDFPPSECNRAIKYDEK